MMEKALSLFLIPAVIVLAVLNLKYILDLNFSGLDIKQAKLKKNIDRLIVTESSTVLKHQSVGGLHAVCSIKLLPGINKNLAFF